MTTLAETGSLWLKGWIWLTCSEMKKTCLSSQDATVELQVGADFDESQVGRDLFSHADGHKISRD